MKPRASAEKRRKERARQERKEAKAERRDRRRAERSLGAEAEPGVAPDLDGTVVDPQSPPREILVAESESDSRDGR